MHAYSVHRVVLLTRIAVEILLKSCSLSLFRWKKKEVHDILVECAKLSLDLNEGAKEEKDESLLPSGSSKTVHITHLNKYDQNIMSPKQFTSGQSVH